MIRKKKEILQQKITKKTGAKTTLRDDKKTAKKEAVSPRSDDGIGHCQILKTVKMRAFSCRSQDTWAGRRMRSAME